MEDTYQTLADMQAARNEAELHLMRLYQDAYNDSSTFCLPGAKWAVSCRTLRATIASNQNAIIQRLKSTKIAARTNHS